MLLIAAMMLSTAVVANAAAADGDFFVGKWELVMLGAPDGDITSVATVTRAGEKLEATVTMDGMEPVKCSRVDVEDADTIVLYFNAGGYDVYIVLDRSDDNTVKGSAMDMLDVTGKRIAE